MSDTQRIIAEEERYCAHNYHPLPVVLTKGQGVWLWDVEGKKYLDMMSAYSAVSHGHSNPRLVKALQEQAENLAITSRAFHTDKLFPFLAKLCQMTQLDMVMPANTGVEAVEVAIKAARRWGYQCKNIKANQAEIIVANDNFHGRTVTVTGFSTDESYRKDFGPFSPGFVSIPFNDVKALEKAITPNTCAFLVEPIQGEAGIHIPDAGWLKICFEICKANNVLLILDEIQTGLGRTGKLFAHLHDNIIPDGLILGKALGGGMLPVSAFVAKKEVMALFNPGSHGSTFGGNPLACQVALEALKVLEEENLTQRSAELGDYFLTKLKTLQSPLVKDVRGKGLLIGMEIDISKVSAREVCEAMMQQGILSKEAHDTVIRFAPPLVITHEELDWAFDKIQLAMNSLHS